MRRRSRLLLAGIVVFAALACWGISSMSAQQHLLPLSLANNGQHVAATVGQQIEITVGTVGPRRYGTAQISSPAIGLGGVTLENPVTPSGPAFTYIFEAAAEGEARIRIPMVNCGNPEIAKNLDFAVTIRVSPSAGKPTALDTYRKPEQANTAAWTGAWTVLQGEYQTFTPSLPLLTAVEVELVVAKPGSANDEVTVTITGPGEGPVLASVSKIVTAAECSHVLFILPKGGVRVSPGELYSIGLSGGNRFGWKYVFGGYAKGKAFLENGELLL